LDNLDKVKAILEGSKRPAALTGAGISAESGVPTFRGEGGLWRNYRAEELATPQAFSSDPELVWEFYDWRRNLIKPLKPNPGHLALAKMEKDFPEFNLVTQNVDGLHQRAGSIRVIELHGNIWHVRCTECHRIGENHDVPIEILPHCDNCGGLLRPHIVWFGESLDPEILDSALTTIRRCDVLLVVGTSAVVQPAASFAGIAKESGAKVIELNLDKTPLSSVVDFGIYGKSGEILPALVGLDQLKDQG